MELHKSENPATVIISGADDHVELKESSKVIIKAGDSELLNDKVPKGKRWVISVSVYIEEYDV